MKKFYSFLALMLAAVSMQAQSWSEANPDTYGYSGYTTVYAHLTSNLPGESFSIAAFIDGTCRASVRAPEPTPDSSILYILTVRGDQADDGKTITFKVYDAIKGFEYPLTPSETITYEDMRTYGYPSGSIDLSVNAARAFSLDFTEAEVGQTYDLMNYTQPTDGGTVLPSNMNWFVDVDASIVEIVGSKLTVKAHYNQPVMLSFMDGTYCYFQIVQHANAITLPKSTFQVTKDDVGAMLAFMKPGIAYQLDPETSTDVVMWEKDDPNGILEVYYTELDTCYYPIKGGTARIRPYVQQKGGKLYPANDAWITVNVIVPVTGIRFNKDIYNGTFFANVGDAQIYKRLQKMITVTPEDATDQSYTIAIPETPLLTMNIAGKDTTLTANGAGMVQVQVLANGADETMAVTDYVDLYIQNPITGATFGENPMYVVMQDVDSKDITQEMHNNVTWVTASGEISENSPQGYLNINGESVTATGEGISISGLDGNYTAVSAGTTTFTITIEWPNYDAWGITDKKLTYNSSQSTFSVVVTTQTTLQGFDVSYQVAAAGETGVLTLIPQPEGATFDLKDLAVNISNGRADAWGAQLTATQKSATASEIVYEITSTIPGPFFVNVLNNGARVPLNSLDSYILLYEIGYPLQLATGWQWLSTPYSAIRQEALADVFGKGDLVEIRTQQDLLYNDPNWGFYGTLNNTVGLKLGQCFKVNMKNAREHVLFGMDVLADMMEGKPNEDGSTTITLMPGWNWVGSPYIFNRQFSTIFANYKNELMDAVIISKTGSATLGENGWEGDETLMKAGQGYVIKNPTDHSIDVIFPAEQNLAPANEGDAGVKSFAARAKVWQYDHTRFMNNMTMVAKIADLDNAEQYSIGAFVGDECRGEGIIENGKAFITVHCNMGEQVTFKLYNAYTGEYRLLEEGLKAQTRVGSLKAPFTFHAGALVDGINGIASGAASSTETYDLSGRRTSTQQRGVSVRRMADGSLRKVIVK